MLINNLIRNLVFFLVLTILFTVKTSGHCDSMEGPVVKASQKALETGNINFALVWVKPENESEIRSLFDIVLKVRNFNEDAKNLADMYFFESVVRLHRLGEGVGYTGLRPADYKPEEGIEAADLAIQNNSIDEILTNLDYPKQKEVKNLFNDLQSKQNYDINDLKSGREYVSSYVHFIHYIENLYVIDDSGSNDEHHH